MKCFNNPSSVKGGSVPVFPSRGAQSGAQGADSWKWGRL